MIEKGFHGRLKTAQFQLRFKTAIKNGIGRIYLNYIKSWDFISAFVLFAIYCILAIAKNPSVPYFNAVIEIGMVVPIVAIIIVATLWILSDIVVISPFDRFLDYLEFRGKAYSALNEYYKAGFLIFFFTFFLHAFLSAVDTSRTYTAAHPPLYVVFLSKPVRVAVVFLTLYSFSYMISLIIHFFKLCSYRFLWEKNVAGKNP